MLGFKKWGGMNKQQGPSAMPIDRLRHTENSRLDAGLVVSRGGQSVFATLTGCPVGLWPGEFQLT